MRRTKPCPRCRGHASQEVQGLCPGCLCRMLLQLEADEPGVETQRARRPAALPPAALAVSAGTGFDRTMWRNSVRRVAPGR